MSMVIKAVFLDEGGTLVDDFETTYSIFLELCKEFSLKSVSRKVFAENTLPITKLMKIVGLNTDYKGKILETYMKKAAEKNQQAHFFSDVVAAVKTLKERGYSLCIVSQQVKSVIEQHLKGVGLNKYFDCIIGFEESPEQKPSPIPIIKALERLGLQPSDAVYCGDMKEDILAGKVAGVMTIGLAREIGSYDTEVHGSYHTREMLESARPDKIVSNLLELVNFLNQNSRTK